MRSCILGVLLGLGGCVGDARDGLGAGAATAGESDDGDGDEDTDAEMLFDVEGGEGEDGTGDGAKDHGCRGIDFLFVIDDSPSMVDEQSNLVASFPGFFEAMTQALDDEAQSFQIMVTDTDAQNGIYGPQQVGCDATLGAGKVNDAEDQPCGIVGGRRFVTDEQPDLEGTFECLALVGTYGANDEMPAGAITRAVDPLVAPGQCNEGFVRDDAILVVTVITDEEDGVGYEGSAGDPSGWHAAVLEAKHGDPEGVVVLGLVGDSGLPNPVCSDYDPAQQTGAQDAVRLREFVGLFGERGSWASVCSPDYSPFFAQAVDLIEGTCDAYVPPQG